YSARGRIVDLGCWLGSTTIALARGLRRREDFSQDIAQHREVVHAYDRFVWEPWMDPFLEGCQTTYQAGDSFLREFKSRIRGLDDLVAVYPGDLTAMTWNGGPVEFLLIDVMKSWPLTNHVIKMFYGHLIPGSSYVVHQDFKHYYTSWIHLVCY